MKRPSLVWVTLGLASVLGSQDLGACTIFKVTRAGVTLVGANEDGTDPITHLHFVPASRGKYGRVYFTLSDRWPQAGVNERGLFYDGTSGPWKAVVKSAHKPDYRGNLSEKMLEECATVDEALALLDRYNLSYFRNGQMFLADRFGNSAIVEGDVVIRGHQRDQVATNFYDSSPDLGGFPCHRYDIARTMLAALERVSPEAAREILQAVHLEGFSYTQYSLVYDPATVSILYFKDADFTKYVSIDLRKELAKGDRWYSSDEFFAQHPARGTSGDARVRWSPVLESRFDTGTATVRLRLTDGLLSGTSEGLHADGRPAWRAVFERGRVRGTLARWGRSGGPVTGYDFVDANRTDIVDYYPGGQLLLRLSLRRIGPDSLAPERITVHNQDGSVSYAGTHRDGLLHLDGQSRPYSGQLSALFKTGRPHMTISYRGGRLHGPLVRRDPSGKPTTTEEYRDGTLTDVKR